MRDFSFRDAPTEPRPQAPQVVFSVNWLGAILISANVAVAFLAYRAFSANPVVGGAIAVSYYSLATPIMLGMVTGAIPYMIVSRQREITERMRLDLQYDLAETQPAKARVAEPLPLGRQPVGHLAAPGTTFVAPVDDSVRNAAMGWIAQLFTNTGEIDTQKVSLANGRVRCAMPDKSAIEYLESRGLIRPAIKDNHQNGWLFDSAALPRRHMALNRI